MLEVREGLSASQVSEGASLFFDLGFDSLAFEGLVARINSRFVGTDLTPWYMDASSEGEDTVGSLVDYLASRLGQAATTESPS